jgi:hypothetical protein
LAGCDDFLVGDLPPGLYEFALQSKQGWALTPVEMVNKNLFLTIAMNPEAEVTGTFVAAHDGMSMTALNRAAVRLNADRLSGPPPTVFMVHSSAGTFSFKGIRGPQHVVVEGLPKPYYASEIRCDGVVARDGIIAPGPGSHVEVVIDDQPATLTGSVTDAGKPYAQPRIYVRPLSDAASPLTGTGDAEGRFQMTGLPPGEYRVLAAPTGPIPDGAPEWTISPQLWQRAQKVTLEKGKQKEIELKLTDPFLER